MMIDKLLKSELNESASDEPQAITDHMSRLTEAFGPMEETPSGETPSGETLSGETS